MITTYYGHSCFGIEYAGKSMLFDPFIRPNALAAHIDVDSICPELMLLSHGHEDHVADAVEIAIRSQAQCVSIYELHSWLMGQGVSKSHPMNIGGEWTIDDCKIRMTPALHSNSLPNGQYGGLATGFAISHLKEPNFYFAGDTALFSDMQLIGKRNSLDVTFLPIGGNFTMDVQDAIQAAQWLGVSTVIGMHYNTFGAICIDQNEAVEAFSNAGLQLELLNIGETRTY
jgi:L-ascorbate metabolism protein UlaG (beta-lactamase superfamily)